MPKLDVRFHNLTTYFLVTIINPYPAELFVLEIDNDHYLLIVIHQMHRPLKGYTNKTNKSNFKS